MIGEFTSYSPDLWSEGGLVTHTMSSSAASKKRTEHRSEGWAVSVGSMPWRIVGAGVVAMTAWTLSFGPTATSFDSLFMPRHAHAHRSAHDPALSPLKEINRSFNGLFESFRAGTQLIPSVEMRELASKAAERRNEAVNVQDWASRLASDIKDAAD